MESSKRSEIKRKLEEYKNILNIINDNQKVYDELDREYKSYSCMLSDNEQIKRNNEHMKKQFTLGKIGCGVVFVGSLCVALNPNIDFLIQSGVSLVGGVAVATGVVSLDGKRYYSNYHFVNNHTDREKSDAIIMGMMKNFEDRKVTLELGLIKQKKELEELESQFLNFNKCDQSSNVSIIESKESSLDEEVLDSESNNKEEKVYVKSSAIIGNSFLC